MQISWVPKVDSSGHEKFHHAPGPETPLHPSGHPAGFIAQHHATGKSPIDNLVDHLANPTGVTFATNGVSVPHFTEFN